MYDPNKILKGYDEARNAFMIATADDLPCWHRLIAKVGRSIRSGSGSYTCLVRDPNTDEALLVISHSTISGWSARFV